MKHIKLISILLAMSAILLSACDGVASRSGSQDNAGPNVQDAATGQSVDLPSGTDPASIGTQAPEPTADSTEASSSALVFNDSGDEAFGTVDAITATTITVNGQTFNLAPGVEIKSEIVAGAFIKLQFITNPDGTISVREVSPADPAQLGNDNSNNANDNNVNTNDNSSGNDNSNDSNTNDNTGGSSNDNTGGKDSGGGKGGNDNGGGGGGNDNGGGGGG